MCRQQVETKQVFAEKSDSCADGSSIPLTKHVDQSEENVDKACLSVAKAIPVNGESIVAVDQANLCAVGDSEWSDIQTTESRIADVREVAPTEGSSHDISEVTLPVNTEHHQQGVPSSHQQP